MGAWNRHRRARAQLGWTPSGGPPRATRARTLWQHRPLVDEDVPQLSVDIRCTATDAYSVSKAVSEHLAWRRAAKHPIVLTAVRPCGIYGAFCRHLQSGVGERVVGRSVRRAP